MVVDGRGVAGRDLRRAGDGTADDEGERTGVERLHGLLRRVDVLMILNLIGYDGGFVYLPSKPSR